MKLLRRALSALLVMIMLCGMFNFGSFISHTTYADAEDPASDPVVETPAEESADPVVETPAEESADPVDAAPSDDPEDPVDAAPSDDPAEPVDAAPSDDPAEPGKAAPSDTPSDPVDETPAAPVEDAEKPAPSETPAPAVSEQPVEEPYTNQSVEHIELTPELEMRLSGLLPAGVNVSFEKTEYEPVTDSRSILVNTNLRIADASDTPIVPADRITVEIKGEAIRAAIEAEQRIGLIVKKVDEEKVEEAKLVKAEEDAVTFEFTEFDLFVLYIELPTETAPAANDATVIRYTFTSLDDYVMLLGLLTQHGVNTVAVDEAYIKEGSDTEAVELQDYLGDWMAAPNKYFEEVVLVAETREGEPFEIVLSNPEPEAPAADYVFESADVALAEILSARGVVLAENNYNVSVDSTAVTLSDSYFNKNTFAQFTLHAETYFDRATLTLRSANGKDTHVITLSYPKPAPYAQTVTVDMPEAFNDTALTLEGVLPAGAEVTVEAVEPAVEDENVLMALDITIDDGYQPDEPILVTVSGARIAEALERGEQITVVHINDDGTQELAEIVSVSGDTVVFRAAHFSEFDLIGSLIGTIAEWVGDQINVLLSGFGVTVKETSVEVEEGLTLLHAYEVAASLISYLRVQIDNSLTLGKLESIAVYRIDDGKLTSRITNLSNIKCSFAIVRDSGLRRNEKSDGAVAVSGLLPIDATVSAVDVASDYADFAPAADKTFDVLAAYDISIQNGEEEYEPDEVVRVSIAVDTDQPVQVWHIVDGEAVPVEDVTVENGVVSFPAVSFSPYVLTTTLTTTITASDGNTYQITVTYDENAGISEEAELRVSELSESDRAAYLERSKEALEAAENVLSFIRVFNIEIVGKESGTVFEPAAPVFVSIEIIQAASDEYLDVVHFGDETEVFTTDTAGNSIRFMTDSFSVYSVIGSTTPGAKTPRRTYYFFNDDDSPFNFTTNQGANVNYLIVKNGESLKNPGAPAPQLSSNNGKEFLGWYIGSTSGEKIQFRISDSFKETDPITDIGNTDETVSVYAKFGTAYNVVYWDEDTGVDGSGNVVNGIIVRTDKVEEDTTIGLTKDSTDMFYTIYTPQHSTDVFLGWSTTPGEHSIAATQITVNASVVDENQTLNLYPVIAPAKWITYSTGKSGSGASYEGAKHWSTAEALTGADMPIPTWIGYVFEGWYDAQDANFNGTGNRVTSFSGTTQTVVSGVAGTGYSTDASGLHITNDITLYAKWSPASNTVYNVTFWVQNVNDGVNLNDYAKSYDYHGSLTLRGETDTEVNLAEEWKHIDTTAIMDNTVTPAKTLIAALGNYFVYNDTRTTKTSENEEVFPVTIANDGSTVINIYYDRKEMTFNFESPISSYYTFDMTDGYGLAHYSNGSTDSYYIKYDGYWRLITTNGYYVWNASRINGVYSSGEIYYMYNNSNYTNGAWRTGYYYEISTTSTITGLYGAPLTNWPSGTWSYYVNGTSWTLPLTWTQFVISPEPTDYATTWNLLKVPGMNQITVHYLGEKMNTEPTGSDPTDIHYFDNTYYQYFTNNEWVYYGEEGHYYDPAKAQCDGNAYYNYVNERKYAQDLTYDTAHELGQANYRYEANLTLSNALFTGYELVGYSWGSPIGTSGAEWKSLSVPEGSTTVATTLPTQASGVTDVYIYYARVRYNLDLYSDGVPIFNATLPYGLNLYPVSAWTPAMIGVTKEGYEFDCWCWDSGLTEEVEWDELYASNPARLAVPAHPVSVFARWKEIEYVAELDFNGGETQEKQDTVFWVKYGEQIKEYANTKREYVNEDSIPAGAVSDSTTRYRYHHFIYVDNEKQYGDIYETNDQRIFFGQLHTGLAIDNNSTWYAPKKAEYYPVTSSNANTVQDFWDRHSVDENGYGESSLSSDLTYYDDGLYVKITDISENAPEYRLVGWYEVIDKSAGRLADYPYDFSQHTYKNTTLRAVWIRNGKYTIKYEYQTGSGTGVFYDGKTVTDSVTNEETFQKTQYSDNARVLAPNVPDNSDPALHFIGWKVKNQETNATYSVYYPGDTFRISADYDPLGDGEYNQEIVMEAVYGTIELASITLDANGGRFVDDNETTHTLSGLSNNGKITLPGKDDVVYTGTVEAGAPTPELKGWAFAADADTPDFLEGDTVAVDGLNNVLYAVWKVGVDVTFIVNGGTWTDTRTSIFVGNDTHTEYVSNINLGETATEPTDPTHEDYMFIGWVETSVLQDAGFAASKTVWSTATTGLSGTGTDYVNDLAWLRDHLYDFSTPVYYDTELVAIWSQSIYVRFYTYYTNSGSDLYHNWNESNDSSYYEFIPESGTYFKYYRVTLAVGDLVEKPLYDPSPNTNSSVSGKNFLYWTRSSDYVNTTATPDQVTPFDFSAPVTSTINLYTSWTDAKSYDVTITKALTGDFADQYTDEEFTFSYTITTHKYAGTSSSNNLVDVGQTTGTFTLTANATDNQNQYSIPLHYWAAHESGSSSYDFYYESLDVYEIGKAGFSLDSAVSTGTGIGAVSTFAKVETVSGVKHYTVDLFTKQGTLGITAYNYSDGYWTWYYASSSANYYLDTYNSNGNSWWYYTSSYQYPEKSGNTYGATFTNKRDTATVNVTKTLRDPNVSDNKAFNFGVQITDGSKQITPLASQITGGEFTLNVANGGTQSKSITVPTDTNVYVIENLGTEDAAAYDTTIEIAEDSIRENARSIEIAAPTAAGGSKTIAFTNIRTVDVTVRKIIAGNAADMDKTFAFTATLNDSTFNLHDFVNGTISFSLGHNDEYVLVVPTGMTLTVTESGTNYVTTVSSDGVDQGETRSYAYTNIIADHTLVFTNTLNLPAPTAFRVGQDDGAFRALLVMSGLIGLLALLPVLRKRRRRRLPRDPVDPITDAEEVNRAGPDPQSGAPPDGLCGTVPPVTGSGPGLIRAWISRLKEENPIRPSARGDPPDAASRSRSTAFARGDPPRRVLWEGGG